MGFIKENFLKKCELFFMRFVTEERLRRQGSRELGLRMTFAYVFMLVIYSTSSWLSVYTSVRYDCSHSRFPFNSLRKGSSAVPILKEETGL